MCGVCGVAGLSDPRPVLERMTTALAHRGPDHSGFWVGAGVGLGHTRLAIVDLSPLGHQPMSNEDGSLWLVANGEIYNSSSLRRELEDKGHRFRSRSDNEVILHLYEEEGLSGLRRLNGMFALALWEASGGRLVLARDRLGIKPLYFAQTEKILVFASEIKAILASRLVQTGINAKGLIEYLTFENTFGDQTLHRDVKMLEPGQGAVWSQNQLKLGSFWEIQFSAENQMDFSAACQAYLETVQASVERHLMSDVEVAAYLSSGFDSTTVSTLASRYVVHPLATFCGTFDTKGWYDESTGAKAVAENIGARHTRVTISPQDLARHMDDLLYALDEPRMGPGSFSQYMVAREAARKYKVILTGHGGDEFFAGYPVFKFVYLLQARKRPLDFIRMLHRTPPAEWPHLVYFSLQRLSGPSPQYFLPVIFTPDELKKALQPDIWQRLSGIKPEEGLVSAIKADDDPYQLLTRVYMRTYLPGLFVVEDKISMAHALESRTPLCDNAVVDLALRLPLELKLHGARLKAIPKKTMREILPPVLYRMPKRGFPTPLALWFRDELSQWVEDRLLRSESRLATLFRPHFLKGLVQAYRRSWRRHLRPLDEVPTHQIWALLCLEAWLRQTWERWSIGLDLN